MKHWLSLVAMLTLALQLLVPSVSTAADHAESSALPQLTAGMIGKVTYLIGQAEATLADGTVIALRLNSEFPAGSRLRVNKGGKLRVILADGGKEVLGAEDAATVFEYNQYQFDPQQPQSSIIRKKLLEGDLDTKTGLGGEAAKHLYRLNTPLAAIGVLGTEYTVRVRDGQTWVVVHSGAVSVAKLGGACLSSGLGACSGGTRLSEQQRSLALVIRADQPAPIKIPVEAVPGAKLTPEASSKAEEPKGAEDNTKTTSKTDKVSDKATDKVSDKAADKATDKANDTVATKTTDKTADKTADKTTDKNAEAAASDKATTAEKTSGKTTASSVTLVVEKPAEGETPALVKPVESTKVAAATTTTPLPAITSSSLASGEQPSKTIATTTSSAVAATPATATAATSPALAATTASTSTLESKTALSTASNTATTSTTLSSSDGSKATPVANLAAPATLVSSGVAPVAVAPSASTGVSAGSLGTGLVATTPVLEATKPVLLPTAGANPISSTTVTSVVTAPDMVTPVVAASGGLAESSKADATLTTATGEVVAAVTQPEPPAPTPTQPASTPAIPPSSTPSSAPAVRWGKYDPAAPVDATTTAADQVDSAYTRLTASALGGYVLERQNEARALPAEQADVSFTLGSYEAAVSNSRSGASVSATIDNARLNVNASRNTYTTGFNLTSALYSGEITASGTFVAADGTFGDAGTGATRLNGVVAVQGETANAAYVFTHQIDPELSASGALNWSAPLASPATPASTSSVTPTTVTGIAD